MTAQVRNGLTHSLAHDSRSETGHGAAGGSLLRRAMVASSSLLAIAAALDSSAQAQTCGAPVAGVATCNVTSYPTGIDYVGFDDLTVNVGSPAGQTGPVTLGGGIYVDSQIFPPTNTREKIDVGSNVTISTTGSATIDDGEAVGSFSGGGLAEAIVISGATITSSGADGIATGAIDGYNGGGGKSAVTSAISNVTNSGAISAYKYGIGGLAKAYAVNAYDASATAKSLIANSGNVSTNGSTGGFGSIAVASNAYARSYGVASYATAKSSIVNSGDITTTGNYADGIGSLAEAIAESYRGYATATTVSDVNNTGTIVTSGTGSLGIRAESLSYAGPHAPAYYGRAFATTAIDNTGNITSTGTGIAAEAGSEALGARGGYAKSTAGIVNSGTIVTSGDYAAGLYGASIALSSGKLYATSYAQTAVGNTGGISTAGYESEGIGAISEAIADADSEGTAHATTAVSNSGSITTKGEFASGIGVGSYSYSRAYEASSYSGITVANSGAISTTGDDASGIATYAGSSSFGVISSSGAKISVVNRGNITTAGKYADGIRAESVASASPDYGLTKATAVTTVLNSGAITTSGYDGKGIDAAAFAYSGNAAYTASNGLASAYASAAVGNSGAIITTGNYSTGIHARGIALGYSYYGGTTTAIAAIVNKGAIKTSGYKAHAIHAQSYAFNDAFASGSKTSYTIVTASTLVANSGALTTSGASSFGIEATSQSKAGYSNAHHTLFGGYNATSTATTSVTNSGAIVTSGDGSIGIHAQADASALGVYSAFVTATTTVANTGAITTSGAGAEGIVAESFGSGGSYGLFSGVTSASVANAGTISTTANYTPAILVIADDPAKTKSLKGKKDPAFGFTYALASNSGSITTAGTGSTGIGSYASTTIHGKYSVAAASSVVASFGTITTSGNFADGIVATSNAQAGSTYTTGVLGISAQTSVINKGTITTSGTYADGIRATAAAYSDGGGKALLASIVDVSNGGSIAVSGEGSVGVYAAANAVVIDNGLGGSISGGTGVHGYSVVAYAHGLALDNEGGGTITGDVDLRGIDTRFENNGTWIANSAGGVSNFTPYAGGTSVVVNRGAVLVVGDHVFKGLTDFENAGLLSLSSANANAGPRPPFEHLEITGDFVGNPGSVLEVGSNMQTVADELKVDGTISGTTLLQVDELGAPGLTSGNGILVAEGGKTSAVNFKLIGNSSADTLVDGAYEYMLGFAPGTGGRGDWYLASRLYPGSYQFGQMGSSALVLSQIANGSITELMQIQQDGPSTQASLAPPPQVASTDNNFVPSSPAMPGTVGGWGRYNYASFDVSPSGSSFGDYHLDANIGNFGADVTVDGSDQTGIFGLYGSTIDGSANFKNFGGSHMSSSGYGISGYGLWLQGPWSAGLLVSSDTIDTHFTDSYIGTNGKAKVSVYGIQAEASYLGHINEDIYFEPFGGLAYTNVGGGSFVDGAGNSVAFTDTQSVVANLKARVGENFMTGDTLLKPYLDFGVNYEFAGGTGVTIGNWSNTSNLTGATAQIGGGLDAEITDCVSLFGHVDYVAGDHVTGWQTYVGLRVAVK